MGPGFGPRTDIRKQLDKLKPEKPKNFKDLFRYLKELIGGFFFRLFYIFGLVWETGKWILFTMTFMALFYGFMPVLSAFISAKLLNTLSDAYYVAKAANDVGQAFESMMPSVIFWLVFQFGYIFLNSLVGSINNVLSRIYGELVVNHIKVKIMKKAKDTDVGSFDMPEFYEKLENANMEAGMRPIQILNAVFSIFSTTISLVSFIIILCNVNKIAPIIIILTAIPTAVLTFIYRQKNFLYIRHRSKDRRQLSYYSSIITDKDMAKEIRILGLSDTFIDRYSRTFKKYFKGLKKLFVSEGLWQIGLTLVNCIVNCFLFYTIAKGVAAGTTQLGDYSLYTGALNSISTSVSSFITTTATIYEGTLFINNMIAFMGEKKKIVPITDKPVAPERHVGHRIEFKNVSFRYPGTKRDVIKNVSFEINAGESVVLVGLNGAGKTTLIKLLTRLYDPTEGVILLDGRDIREYDVDLLYRMFGIVFQDFGRYAVNVTENISFGELDKTVDIGNIKSAAEQSSANEFIDKLPMKYDTPLMRIFEDDGIELSTGQWQKLAVARAFYSDSDILILDEPTAALDAIAEQEIYSQFDKLRKDKTTIFVSHRLSSATVASKIIVLEYGKLIEMGNHKELMAKKGRYYELFSTQASRYFSKKADGTIDTMSMNTDGEPGGGFAEADGMPASGGRPGFMPPHIADPENGKPHFAEK